METLNVKWIGTNPLLMHNERLADPMSEASKALAEVTSKRGNAKKTDAHVEDVARLEWEGGLYHDDEVGPYLPTHNIAAAIREGARLSRLGKEIERAVVVLGDKIPVDYTGPRDIEGMWAAKLYDRSGVRVGQAKVMRTRPKFARWSVAFEIAFNPERITREQLVSVMSDAGKMTGIGDFRARFGRFEVSA
jgi:hypothetical protein